MDHSVLSTFIFDGSLAISTELRIISNVSKMMDVIYLHPETSADGEPIDSLEYPSEQWKMMLENLERIAQEENIPLSKLNFITNSKDALLLSEAAKQCGREIFYTLHEKLFEAYFVDGKNIGDRNILKTIASSCGIDNETIEASWTDSNLNKRLMNNFNTARAHNIQSVPSFIFGERVLTGVVAEATFREAAAQLCSANND
jgi:predicted DsbA family dithiol-disulfide isomerase